MEIFLSELQLYSADYKKHVRRTGDGKKMKQIRRNKKKKNIGNKVWKLVEY